MATTVAANSTMAAAAFLVSGLAVVHNAHALNTNVPITIVKITHVVNMSAQIALSTNAANTLLIVRNTNALLMAKLASGKNAMNMSVLNMSYNVPAMALVMRVI